MSSGSAHGPAEAVALPLGRPFTQAAQDPPTLGGPAQVIVASPFFIGHEADWHVEVDIGALVRALLLFDHVVVVTTRMKEWRELVRVLGLDDVKLLLESGAVSVMADNAVFGERGRNSPEFRTDGRGPLPINSYTLHSIAIGDRHEIVQGDLGRELSTIDTISQSQRDSLTDTLLDSLRGMETSGGAARDAGVYSDLLTRPGYVTDVVVSALNRKLSTHVDASDLHLKIERIGDIDFAVEHNLVESFRLDPIEAHVLVRDAIFAIARVNERLEYAAQVDALPGSREDERELMIGKLARVLPSLDPVPQLERLDRVVAIASLPDVREVLAAGERRVDIPRLLNVRELDHTVAFRRWLRGTDEMPDQEVAELIKSMRRAMRLSPTGPAGHVVRIAAATAVGIVSLPAGGALGVIDQFLLDRLLPRKGPIMFLDRLYGSLFG